jgi:hypothetical protein
MGRSKKRPYLFRRPFEERKTFISPFVKFNQRHPFRSHFLRTTASMAFCRTGKRRLASTSFPQGLLCADRAVPGA